MAIYIALDLVLEAILWVTPGEGTQRLLVAVIAIRLAALIGTIVTVAMWTHRANANLHESGVEGLEFTPGWAVGWYFVPIANLFKPFQAMREIWNATFATDGSYTSEADPLLVRWWALWISSNMLTNISERALADSPAYNWVSLLCTALTIGAGISTVQIVRRVTTGQEDRGLVADIFA